MSKSTHKIAVKAVDQTGGAFKSIGMRAKATAESLRGMLGGALAAAGTYMGMRSVVSGINTLGHMSDIAMKTSTNVGELTQTLTALNILGIQNMGMENLARVFDYMQKNTGRSGLDGLIQTIGEIGKIEDSAQRAQMAMKAFGRSGMELLPLINAAGEGTAALEGLIKAQVAVPQAAADAGDDAADAMEITTKAFKSIWLQAIGAICGWFGEQFTGGIREAAAAAANYLEYYAKLAVVSVKQAWKEISGTIGTYGAAWGAAFETWTSGGGFMEGFYAMGSAFVQSQKELDAELAKSDKENQARADAWAKTFADRAAYIAQMAKNYKDAAMSNKNREKMKIGVGSTSTTRSATIKNDLILAGSNDAAKLAAFGPQYQSEAKKQTTLLETIAKNTEATTQAIEDGESETNFGVVGK